MSLTLGRRSEPQLRIDRAELRPGDAIELHLTLPGPADLDELFLTLRCDKWVPESEWPSVERIISILREEHVKVPRGQRFERQLFMTMPEDAPRSVAQNECRFDWTFEVEARPERGAVAIDEFPIRVQ